MPRFGTTPLLLKIWSSGELWLPSKTNTERPHQKNAKHLQGKSFMVNTYLQCLQSLWMLFGTIVQKVFESNFRFRYQRVRNQKKKVSLFLQIWYCLVPNIEICLKYFLDKNPKKQPQCNDRLQGFSKTAVLQKGKLGYKISDQVVTFSRGMGRLKL